MLTGVLIDHLLEKVSLPPMNSYFQMKLHLKIFIVTDVLCLSSIPLRNDPTHNPWPGCGRSVLHILHLLPPRLRDVRHRGLCEGDQLNHTPSSLALNLGVLMLCPLCLLLYLVQHIQLPCCDPGGCSLLL